MRVLPLCGVSMLEEVLAQRFEFLKNRGNGTWFSSLRQQAWESWRQRYTVAELPESWRAELLRAASRTQETKAAKAAAQDARHMWRRLATQAEHQHITQKEGSIESLALPSSVRDFLQRRLNEAHPLALLQIALLSDGWCVHAADGASGSDPLQPPPRLSLWDELFALQVFEIGADAKIEVIAGCIAPKGARSQLIHAHVGERAHLTWITMDHAPAIDAEAGARQLVLESQAQCVWREVRLNAGPGLVTKLEKKDGATLEYQGLWGAATAPVGSSVLAWWEEQMGHCQLWLLGSIQVPAVPQTQTFRLPVLAWPWRLVQVSAAAWRQFCLEQFLLPFLRNLPVEYQADIVRFAELMDQSVSEL